jgi:hypothetical protein
VGQTFLSAYPHQAPFKTGRHFCLSICAGLRSVRADWKVCPTEKTCRCEPTSVCVN